MSLVHSMVLLGLADQGVVEDCPVVVSSLPRCSNTISLQLGGRRQQLQ